MEQQFTANHFVSAEKNPAGGLSEAIGIRIQWQNGPLKILGVEQPQNGAFVETVLNIAKDRLMFYQNSKFNCPENKETIEHIEAAVKALNKRTADRTKRGVEGTHAE